MDENRAYALDAREQRMVDETLEGIRADRGLYRRNRMTGEYVVNQQNQPIALPYEVLPGKSHCIDNHGRVWRMRTSGTPMAVAGTRITGKPWTVDVVEMWTGKWRKVGQPDGSVRYAKHLIWAPVSPGVNEHPGTTHIDWYLNRKGFKHPLDPPDAPDKTDIAILENQEVADKDAIYAKAEAIAAEQHIDIEETGVVKPKPQKPARTPRRKPRRTNKPVEEPSLAAE